VALIALGGQAAAQSRVLDRIEVRPEGDNNIVAVHFALPVRYVSHVTNDARSEIGVQLQIVQTTDIALEDLIQRDQLSWNPTEEIPLSKVVYQGIRLGTSSLLVSFATPIKQFRIRQSRDFYVMEFVLKKPSKLPQVEIKPVPAIDIDVPETRPPLTFKSLPLVIYVINLSSETTAIDPARIAPVPIEGNQALYTTKAMVNGREWHRLRLGFFRTHQEAKDKLRAVKNFYPGAWIDRADIKERRQALFESGLLPEPEPEPVVAETTAEQPVAKTPALPAVEVPAPAGLGVAGAAIIGGAAEVLGEAADIDREPPAETAEAQPPAEEQPMSPADERLTKMIELIRRTMTAGEYGKAVRMLQGFLEEPENYYTKEARELLGLARERNGQTAHAKAEYEAFLEKYPHGEDAERVQQRLLGLVTAPKAPREPLREEKRDSTVEWQTYGSLSQHYRRDSVDYPGDEGDLVSRSEIQTFFDVNSRRRSETLDLHMKLTGSYVNDLLGDGPGNDKILSYAYIDVEHLSSRGNLRVGRQRLRSSGTLNRFDGLVLGYELTPDIRLRGVAGMPVDSTRDVFLNKHKEFMGVSGDIANLFENWDVSLFFIDQQVDSLTDRRAVGGEFRYFDKQKSLYGLLDYDINFGALNIFALQGNWTLADKTRVYMNLNYRTSPLLRTSNALRSYYDPDLYAQTPQVLDQVESIDELLQFESEDAIYSRAEALTAETQSLQIGASRPLSPSLQINGDITITNTSDTPQQGTIDEATQESSHDYIAAVPGTGTEYYLNLQLIKNDLLKEGDIGILNFRYDDTSNANTLRLGASSRYPISNLWRINSRVDLAYRKRSDTGNTKLTLSPHMRMDYRLRKNITLEFEGGIDWSKEENDLESGNYTNYFFTAGYRWNF
jgi:TolA-binding protein